MFQLTEGDVKSPLFLIVDASYSKGGVRYKTENVKATARKAKTTVVDKLTKVVDNQEVVTEMNALINRANYACRKACAWTRCGWIAAPHKLEGIKAEFDRLGHEATDLNKLAKARGSAHRISIGVVTATLHLNQDFLFQTALAMHDVIGMAINALEAGEIRTPTNRVRTALLAGANLDEILAGDTREEWLSMILLIEEMRAEMMKGGKPSTAVLRGYLDGRRARFSKAG